MLSTLDQKRGAADVLLPQSSKLSQPQGEKNVTRRKGIFVFYDHFIFHMIPSHSIPMADKSVVRRVLKKEPINSSEKFEIHINFIPSYHPIPLAFTSSDIYPPTPIVQDRVKYSKKRF